MAMIFNVSLSWSKVRNKIDLTQDFHIDEIINEPLDSPFNNILHALQGGACLRKFYFYSFFDVGSV